MWKKIISKKTNKKSSKEATSFYHLGCLETSKSQYILLFPTKLGAKSKIIKVLKMAPKQTNFFEAVIISVEWYVQQHGMITVPQISQENFLLPIREREPFFRKK